MERDLKMNVWIRGSKTNPKGVIAILEKLGGKNIWNVVGKDINCIYIIYDNGTINYYHINSLEAHCIMNTFKEIQSDVVLRDKQLVWAWDDDTDAGRNIRFYDAKNNCTFCPDGQRNGCEYDNYELYEGEYPEWAKEAVKQLQD